MYLRCQKIWLTLWRQCWTGKCTDGQYCGTENAECKHWAQCLLQQWHRSGTQEPCMLEIGRSTSGACGIYVHVSRSQMRMHLTWRASGMCAVRCGGDAASASSSSEGRAAAPPEDCGRRGGMPAAFEGASDSCPELALAELTPDAFLQGRDAGLFVQSAFVFVQLAFLFV